MTLIMGKRQINQLQVFDFLVAITIGSLAGADLGDPKIHHGPTIFGIVVLALFQVLVTWGKVKNRFFNNLATLKPTIVVQNGVILKENLKSIRYTVENLLSMLREKNIFKLSELEYVIVEPSGQLSILKKTQNKPVTPKDLKLDTAYDGLSILLVLEGKILEHNLAKVQLSKKWLLNELQNNYISDITEVLVASLEPDGSLYLSQANPEISEFNVLENVNN